MKETKQELSEKLKSNDINIEYLPKERKHMNLQNKSETLSEACPKSKLITKISLWNY